VVGQGYPSRYGDGLWAGGSHLDSQHGYETFLDSIASGPALVPTQSLMKWMLVAISAEVKWPGREPNHRLDFHLLRSKMVEIYVAPPLPPKVLMA
jgi:hypothetical protein